MDALLFTSMRAEKPTNQKYSKLRAEAFPPSPPIPLSRPRVRGGRDSIIFTVTNKKNVNRISLVTHCLHCFPSPLGPPSPPGFDAGEAARF